MIEGGEDVKFIARRLFVAASEDGNANPNALVLANSTFQAVTTIGFPEARIILSQCTLYLANSPKSNAAYEAINSAQSRVKETGNLGVPLHLRNAPTALMKDLNYGKGYNMLTILKIILWPKNTYQKKFPIPVFMNQEESKRKSKSAVLKQRWKDKYGYQRLRQKME